MFAGIWAMARFGGRNTLLVGLVWFALGNLLCGAAVDVPTLAAAKLVEGVGKGMVIVICRSLLYRQFDRMVIVAIGFYGVIAYATRPTTPLLTALVNDCAVVALDLLGRTCRWHSWRFPLVRRFIKPDRPPRAAAAADRLDRRHPVRGLDREPDLRLRLVSQMGRLDVQPSRRRPCLPCCCPSLWSPGSGPAVADEHLRRMFRVRIYVLAMCVRMLMLVQLLAVLTLMANYLPRAARLPPRGGRLDSRAGDGHDGGLDLPDHLVSPPVAAALLAVRRRRRLRRVSVVDVLGGQLHEQGAGGPDDRLLGPVRRPASPCVSARRSRGAGPPRRPVRGRARGRFPDRSDDRYSDHDQHDRFRLDRPGSRSSG